MTNGTAPDRPIQTYPTEWQYKVIGRDENDLRTAVRSVLGEREFTIRLSNTSSKKQYCCLNVELTVQTETERDQLFRKLKGHDCVILVL